jgi:TolB-like protein
MRNIVFFVVMFIFIGCVRESYNIKKTFPHTKDIRVIPFANFTQTPMAGYKVAGILEGVLRSKNVKFKGSLWDFEERDYSIEDIKKLISDINSTYIITGYVNEFRYKTGIDGEPAVSVTIKIYDKTAGKYIYISTFSRVGDTYNSLGVLTQEGFNKIFSDLELNESK